MNKKNKIIIIVLVAVLAISAVFLGLTTSNKFVSKITGSIDAENGAEDISAVQPVEYKTDYPLVQTQQKDLFYSAYPDGTIKYYKFANGTFSQVKDSVKTKDVTITCSYQNVKVKLYYLSTDVGTVGYGLYDSKQDSKVKSFSYIFVRLMDCPDSYKSTTKTSYILLTDMDAEDSYKTDKTYSDMYTYDMSSGTTTLVISQRDRTVEENGTFREDWTIYTDYSLNSMKKYDFFTSSRNYDINDDNRKYDILSVENARSMKKSTATTVTNSPSYNIWENDGSYFCLKNTDKGFDLIKNADKKKPLKSFSGSFDDYAVSEHWILNKSSLEFTDAYTGETKSCKKSTFSVLSGFIASESGDKFILFCQGNSQSMIMYDTASKTAKSISNSNIYNTGICNFCFIDESTFVVTTYDEDNAAINRICKF